MGRTDDAFALSRKGAVGGARKQEPPEGTVISRGKGPSSLDYEGHLHELALRSWRRAVLDADVPRARRRATTLVDSPARLWRFIGLLHLATAEALAGSSRDAFQRLAHAEGLFTHDPALSGLARRIRAHYLLALGANEEALSRLSQPRGAADERCTYLRGLAHVGAGRAEQARREAETLGPGLLHEHLHAVLTPGCRLLVPLSASLDDAALATDTIAVPIRFDLGVRLDQEQRYEEALDAFASVADAPASRCHWPIHHVRSLERAGTLAARAGANDRAAAFYRTFLWFWSEGDLDHPAVERARQFVSA